MPSQWPAVGAETDPLRRARQLQKSWERLLADGALGPELPPGATVGLRPTIVESWQRSLATGLDPTDLLAPIEADESEVLGRWFDHPLGSLTHVLTEQLRKLAEESRGMVVVTDASGLVLHRVGDESLKERAVEMNLVEGARYDEGADGTNGIGTALAADHAFEVFAFEHFNERHHQWVCSGAPVHDPVSGQTVGLIDLSTLWTSAHPQSLELVTTAARTIEQHLLDARRDRDARLRHRYTDFMTRSTDLLVDRDGYVLDGAELASPSPFDIPEDGGEVVLPDGSVAIAAPLGRGEAFLLRKGTTRHAKSAPAAKGLERTEERARELAGEQAALRQVATLVARESSPEQLFAVVAEQAARIFDVPYVRLVLYEPDGSVVVGGFSEGDHEPFPIGSRWPLDSPGVTANVRQTGRPARVEDYAHLTGEIAAVVRSADLRSAVASPIVVERHLWGAMVVLSPRDEPLPEDTEARLTDFTELVATAIANAESREALARLAEEQAALRRVATLVAGGTGPDQLFAAVADEAQELFGAEISAIIRFEDDATVVTVGARGGPNAAGTRAELDPDFIVASVRETRRAARFDTDDPAAADMPAIVRETGARSAVASPIVVEGKLWGAIVVGSLSRSLPHGTERRLADFTELIATAVANTQARQEVTALADEQAALRRVAVLVAQGVRPARIFSAVSDEVGRLFGCDQASVTRFDSDGSAIEVVGVAQNIEEVVTVGTRWELHDSIASARVFRTGRSARVDRSAGSPAGGPAAETIAHLDLRSTVASPIVVEGRLWGTITVSSSGEWLPADTEQRVEKFTELVATAVANAHSGQQVRALAEEQAALRRVAVLVAQQASPSDVFTAVTQAVGLLLGADLAVLHVFPGDGTATTIASWSGEGGPILADRVTVSTLDGDSLAARIFESGAPARIDSYAQAEGEGADLARSLGLHSAVGAPILVEGKLWGALMAATRGVEPWAANAESRIAAFTELLATAIASAEARDALAQLAEEQAALRRVATLVAQGASPQDLFEAVAEEIGRLLPVGSATMGRFEPDDTVTTMASWSSTEVAFPTGQRWPTEGTNVAWMVRQTGRSARLDDFSAATDPIGVAAREAGIKSAVGSPIVVEGHLWGVMTATSTEGPLPPDTEARLASFTELVATAIANAKSQNALEQLADEQAALRRIATLVAKGILPEEVFAAVAEEVAAAFRATTGVLRFEHDPPGVVLVGASKAFDPIGTRWDIVDLLEAAEVYRTGRPARVNRADWASVGGAVGEAVRRLGIVSTVACPIIVEGSLWGVITVSAGEELPHDTEQRLEKFTELVTTAIANAEGKSALAASRRRIVAASDEARRRIERDLHDGTQQRLVSLGLAVRAAEANLAPERQDVQDQLSRVASGLVHAVEDLQEISRGIHPAILSKGGLGPALQTLAHRSAIRVDLDITTDVRLAEPIEVAAYFVASEALANAGKHSDASRIDVSLERRDGNLLLSVRDDGVGGADGARGSGIVGLNDRVEALGGSLRVDSPVGEGTQIVAQLPLDLELDRPL